MVSSNGLTAGARSCRCELPFPGHSWHWRHRHFSESAVAVASHRRLYRHCSCLRVPLTLWSVFSVSGSGMEPWHAYRISRIPNLYYFNLRPRVIGERMLVLARTRCVQSAICHMMSRVRVCFASSHRLCREIPNAFGVDVSHPCCLLISSAIRWTCSFSAARTRCVSTLRC